MKYFQTKFLEDADKFIATLAPKTIQKIFFNINLAEYSNDPKLFKKLQNEIWEFRIRYDRQQIRLLAFWDKTKTENTLVFATHGFIKKVDKISSKEIERAEKIRIKYFETKNKYK